jgi:hypothetical protein
MIVNGTILGEDINQMGATSGQVLKWTGSAWAPRNDSVGGAGDNAWVRGTPDSVLYTIRQLGIARGGANNMLWGNNRFTHTNLGVASTTGTSGQDKAYCTVAGGYCNAASDHDATVGGGYADTALGFAATVAGGYRNTASGDNATVGGGYHNTASGTEATVGGGGENTASGIMATVGGGIYNTASGYISIVAGGYRNVASDSYATVAGGNFNTASGKRAFVGGGYYNTALGFAATVGGGYADTALGFAATVAGGYRNTASGYYATVGGGYRNSASGDSATVAGGYRNSASGKGGTVGGGLYNTASGNIATVSGGYVDTAAASYSFATNYHSVVPSGFNNSAAFNGQTATASDQLRCGILSKAGGSFTIDHPLDPYNKILNHYFIEGPEMLNLYRGSVILDANGRAEVKLPEYFSALNRNPMVVVSGVGTSDVYILEEVKGNRFVIGGKPGTKVYWIVTGERNDVSAEAIRRLMPVEQLKTEALYGRMLDDEFLSGCMEQLEREGKAQGINFRTPEGRRRYEQMKNPEEIKR